MKPCPWIDHHCQNRTWCKCILFASDRNRQPHIIAVLLTALTELGNRAGDVFKTRMRSRARVSVFWFNVSPTRDLVQNCDLIWVLFSWFKCQKPRLAGVVPVQKPFGIPHGESRGSIPPSGTQIFCLSLFAMMVLLIHVWSFLPKRDSLS